MPLIGPGRRHPLRALLAHKSALSVIGSQWLQSYLKRSPLTLMFPHPSCLCLFSSSTFVSNGPVPLERNTHTRSPPTGIRSLSLPKRLSEPPTPVGLVLYPVASQNSQYLLLQLATETNNEVLSRLPLWPPGRHCRLWPPCQAQPPPSWWCQPRCK